MIDLTPLEVRQKKTDFPRGLRGYDPGHVDDFLDLVADRLEALVKENRRLAEEVASLRSSTGEYRDREKALTDALVSAQQMRETVREQSTKEAELMRREAEHEARRVRSEALRSIEKEEETLRRLRARQRQLVDGYRGMLERELRELAVVAESLGAAESSAVGGVVVAGADAATSQKPSRSEEPDRPGPRDADRPAPDGSGAGTAGRAPASAKARDETMGDGPDAGGTGPAQPTPGARRVDEAPATSREGRTGKPAASKRADAEPEDTGGDPWALPRRPAEPGSTEDGSGRDRLAAPAASLDAEEPPAKPSPGGRAGEGRSPAHPPGEEPDWLAAILKEE